MSEESVVGLADAIRALREELSRAQVEGAESGLRFHLNPVKLTVQTVVSREASGSGKVRWWLLDASVEGKAAREVTQTLEIELVPLERSIDGQLKPAEIADVSPTPQE